MPSPPQKWACRGTGSIPSHDRKITTFLYHVYAGIYWGIPSCCVLRWSYEYVYTDMQNIGRRGAGYTSRFYDDSVPPVTFDSPRWMNDRLGGDYELHRRGRYCVCGIFHKGCEAKE